MKLRNATRSTLLNWRPLLFKPNVKQIEKYRNNMSERDPLLTQSTVDRVKKNIADAGNNVAGKVNDFVETAKNGNTSVRGLALVSGVALVASSSNQVYGGIVTLSPSSALIAFYSLVMGSIAIAMEMDPQALPYGQRIRNWLIKYIGLVQLSTGRGLFYFIAGSLELTQVRGKK